MVLLVTCEHGGNGIPAAYRHLFRGHEASLDSHRGHDPGALSLARDIASACKAPLVASTVSRLLIELNRSPHHRALYSRYTRDLPADEKARIRRLYYEPYRLEVQQRVAETIAAGRRVFHLSAHTFTPVLGGVVRQTDIGMLYDPRRPGERELCQEWASVLGQRLAPLRVRRNYPYRGYDDGLTTFLRRCFAPDEYIGVEIEVNQKHALGERHRWRALRRQIVQSVLEISQTFSARGASVRSTTRSRS